MKTKENILLNIKDLHVWYRVYGGYLKIIDGVDLMVREGERIGLVGESGCGKTTAMKSIMQILPPGDFHIPRGQIFYKGQDVLKMSFKEIQRFRSREIAMLFQDPTAALNPVFTIGTQIGDVIKYSAALEENVHQEKIKTLSIKALKEVYLTDPKRMLINYPFQLSGGMKQRVCIAMSSISSPRNLLIVDEPGTSLDVTIQDQIIRLLNEIVKKRKTSIISITHSLGVAREMADRIYVMYAGTIVETATSEVLFKNPVHPYTKGLLACVPKISGGGIASGIPGKIPSYLNPPSGCRFRPRCEQESPICSEEPPQLFEIEKDHLVACYLTQR